MFRFPQKETLCLAESLVALVSANLVICISTIYPLFSTTLCHREYAAPPVCNVIDALLPWSSQGSLLL